MCFDESGEKKNATEDHRNKSASDESEFVAKATELEIKLDA